jgi:hypothetical protein
MDGGDALWLDFEGVCKVRGWAVVLAVLAAKGIVCVRA